MFEYNCLIFGYGYNGKKYMKTNFTNRPGLGLEVRPSARIFDRMID